VSARVAHRRAVAAGRAALLCLAAAPAVAAGGDPQDAVAAPGDAPAALRVCADPDNLPFSNRLGQGFENRIAALVAADLHAELQYTWHPQRQGFLRQTLQARRCDLVIGVPAGLERVRASRPYYRSSYVFIYAQGRALRPRTLDDPALRTARIGLHAFGDDGANSPAALALADRGISRNIIGFSLLDTAQSPPGRIVDAVAAGEIDVAIAWGPSTAPFARGQAQPLAVVPLREAAARPGLPFAYDIAMAVRPDDEALAARIDDLLERRGDDIRHLLATAGVPLVEAAAVAAH